MDYKMYIKSRKNKNLERDSVLFAEVLKANITEDLLQKSTSTIECDVDLSVAEEGDIIGIYDGKGNVVYNGIVEKVDEKTITTNQMANLFAGDYYAMAETSAEKTYLGLYNPITVLRRDLAHIINGYRTSKFTVSSNTEVLSFMPIDSNTHDNNSGIMVWLSQTSAADVPEIPYRTQNAVIDGEQMVYEMYSQYGIITTFKMPYNKWNVIQNPNANRGVVFVFLPELGCYRESFGIRTYDIDPYPVISFGDNSEFITDVNVLTEVEDSNLLYILNSGGTTYRALYTVYTDGSYVKLPDDKGTIIAYDNSRYNPVRAKFVNSDETLAKVVSANLKANQYNHKINLSVIFDNNFYKWSDFKLGQRLNFYVGSRLYNSVLTGWKYTLEKGKEITRIDFVCGKVRSDLTSKLNLGKVK